MKPFDPYDPDHRQAYRSFVETCIWPPECDIEERTKSPIWVILIQAKLAQAFIERTELDDRNKTK